MTMNIASIAKRGMPALLACFILLVAAASQGATGMPHFKLIAQAASGTVQPGDLRAVMERAKMDGEDQNLPSNVSYFLGLLPEEDDPDLPVKKLKDESTGRKRIFEVSLRHDDAAVVILFEGNEVYFYRTDAAGAQKCRSAADGTAICGAKWIRDRNVIEPHNAPALFEAEKRFWISNYGSRKR